MKSSRIFPGEHLEPARNKVIVNTLPLLAPLAGIGNYTLNISKAFLSLDQKSDYTFSYGNYYSRELYTYEDNFFIRCFCKVKESLKKNHLFALYARKLKDILPSLRGQEFDLYFEPNVIPTNIKAKKVVITVCDLSFKKFPHYQPRDRTEYFNRHLEEGLRRSDQIIVLSKEIKKELIDLMGIKEEVINVIPAGVDGRIFKIYSNEEVEGVRTKYRLPEKFILYVGTIEPRKNLKGLLDAFLRFNIKNEYKLILVGASGWENKDELQLFTSHDDVMFLGHVPNVDIALLMNAASCLAYTSFYEGFGLPPLEAMACGCPVVVSDASSIPEACGDAAYYVDPHNIDSISEGICKVVTDETLRQVLIKKGLERVKHFSWEESAKKHLEVFKEALSH